MYIHRFYASLPPTGALYTGHLSQTSNSSTCTWPAASVERPAEMQSVTIVAGSKYVYWDPAEERKKHITLHYVFRAVAINRHIAQPKHESQ